MFLDNKSTLVENKRIRPDCARNEYQRSAAHLVRPSP